MYHYVLLTICLFVYSIFFVRRRQFLKKTLKGMRNVPIFPFVDSAPYLYRNNGRDFYKKLQSYFKTYGDNFYMMYAGSLYVCFSAQEDIKAILTSKKLLEVRQNEYRYFESWLGDSIFVRGADVWKRKRKQFYAFFNFKAIENSISVFEYHCETLIESLRKECDTGVDFNIHHRLESFAMDVIAEIVLGERNNSHKGSTALQHYIEEFDWFFALTRTYKQFQHNTKQCRAHIQNVIDEMKQRPSESLTLNDAKSFCEYMCAINAHESPISDSEINGELLGVMFAGHDTMTSSLSFLVYCLGKYPEIQEKVYQEIKEIIKPNEKLTIQAMNKLRYTNSVMREVLRMYPAAPAVAKETAEDIELNGIKYPAGTTFFVGLYNAHHNPRNYADPEKFIPERHEVEKSVELNNAFNFIAFAPGVRACKGNKIAECEMKTFIIKLLNTYKIELKDGFEPEISWDVVLKPYNGISIKLVSRN